MSGFDKPVNRRKTNSYKWDVSENELPMWVADMDFELAPVIRQAISDKVAEGVFGYNIVPLEFQQAFVYWWEKYHDFKMQEDWIMFCTGVVPAISSIVRKLTRTGDNIVVLSPVYNIFYNSIQNNFRNVLPSNLIYQNNGYQIDFDDLEIKLKDVNTSMLIFCNPHNPIGKVWTESDLRKVGELCVKYNVIILSDEIHCDITRPRIHYTPFLSLGGEIAQRVIMCASPSKAFNMAGIQTSGIIVKNAELRQKVNRGINTDEVAEPNSFAVPAVIAAYTKGRTWLNELNRYLEQNRKYIEKFVESRLPELKLIKSEATYLAWFDCSQITEDARVLGDFIQAKTGLLLSSGEIFGENSRAFMRLNYATTRKNVEDAMTRFALGVAKFLRRELA